jgi:hypothetical protein
MGSSSAAVSVRTAGWAPREAPARRTQGRAEWRGCSPRARASATGDARRWWTMPPRSACELEKETSERRNSEEIDQHRLGCRGKRPGLLPTPVRPTATKDRRATNRKKPVPKIKRNSIKPQRLAPKLYTDNHHGVDELSERIIAQFLSNLQEISD